MNSHQWCHSGFVWCGYEKTETGQLSTEGHSFFKDQSLVENCPIYFLTHSYQFPGGVCH